MKTSNKQIPGLLFLILWQCFAQAAFGATRGGEDTILVYDANTYKGASWKINRQADTEGEEVIFRSITGWDRNNVLILGYSGSKVLLRRYSKGEWLSKTLPLEGNYASYRARMCSPDTFLFAYEGRSGTCWSLYQGATETSLGNWNGLVRRGTQFNLATMYRIGDKTFIHPCRHNRMAGNNPQVFVSDGTATEPLSRGEKGYFIQDASGEEASMLAGSIADVQAPTATGRVGVWNCEDPQGGRSWRTAVVILRDGIWKVDKVLPFDTGFVFGSWAHSERELIICGQRGAYIYENGQTRSVNLPETQVARCAWGKDLKDFFILTAGGAVLHLADGGLRQEVVGPQLASDLSARTDGTPENLEKIREGPQEFGSVWVSPEGIVYAIRFLLWRLWSSTCTFSPADRLLRATSYALQLNRAAAADDQRAILAEHRLRDSRDDCTRVALAVLRRGGTARVRTACLGVRRSRRGLNALTSRRCRPVRNQEFPRHLAHSKRNRLGHLRAGHEVGQHWRHRRARHQVTVRIRATFTRPLQRLRVMRAVAMKLQL
jgi:hypothetical protein